MAILYKVDGTQESYPNFKDLKVKAVQKMIGGYFETIRLNTTTLAIVNEDGYPLHLPENEGIYQVTGVQLVGDVILCSVEEYEAWNG